jgi:hypothetical protein
MQNQSPENSMLIKGGTFVVKAVFALFCAMQSAILLDEKAWLAFGMSLLLFLLVFLSKKTFPSLTLPMRAGLFLCGEFAMILARSWNGGV